MRIYIVVCGYKDGGTLRDVSETLEKAVDLMADAINHLEIRSVDLYQAEAEHMMRYDNPFRGDEIEGPPVPVPTEGEGS